MLHLVTILYLYSIDSTGILLYIAISIQQTSGSTNDMAKLGEYGDMLNNMTAQEVFDVTVKHLATLEASCTINSHCVYNGLEGMTCAAGIFINNYDTEMEGCDWAKLIEWHSKSSGTSDKHCELIQKLQNVHDSEPFDEWAKALLLVAFQEDLCAKSIKKYFLKQATL